MKKVVALAIVLIMVMCLYGVALAEEENRVELYSGVYVVGDILPVGSYLVSIEGEQTVIVKLYENMDKAQNHIYDEIDKSYGGQHFFNLKEGYVLSVNIFHTEENRKPSHVYLTPMNFKVVVE